MCTNMHRCINMHILFRDRCIHMNVTMPYLYTNIQVYTSYTANAVISYLLASIYILIVRVGTGRPIFRPFRGSTMCIYSCVYE